LQVKAEGDGKKKKQKPKNMPAPFFSNGVVAKVMWERISDVICRNRNLGYSVDNISVCWLSNKKYASVIGQHY
jgi:hypothetical protein